MTLCLRTTTDLRYAVSMEPPHQKRHQMEGTPGDQVQTRIQAYYHTTPRGQNTASPKMGGHQTIQANSLYQRTMAEGCLPQGQVSGALEEKVPRHLFQTRMAENKVQATIQDHQAKTRTPR